MQRDSINHGETYQLTISAEDEDGVQVPIDGSYQVMMRVCKDRVGGEPVMEVPLTIQDGSVHAEVDTGDAPWEPGTFVYDLRITHPDGRDEWNDPTQLVLRDRCSPTS